MAKKKEEPKKEYVIKEISLLPGVTEEDVRVSFATIILNELMAKNVIDRDIYNKAIKEIEIQLRSPKSKEENK